MPDSQQQTCPKCGSPATEQTAAYIQCQCGSLLLLSDGALYEREGDDECLRRHRQARGGTRWD